MLPDDSGAKPKIGCDNGPGLGVRVPMDDQPDANGVVRPNTGGMSVMPSITSVLKRQPHLVPKDLRSKFPGARGGNVRRVWSYGAGIFTSAALTAGLVLRVESSYHGLVKPSTQMMLSEYQQALAQTQDGWRKDED